MSPARSPHESHCLSGFLKRFSRILYPEESISLQEDNTGRVDDAHSEWTTADDEESDEKPDAGEVDDARSDWSTTEDEESDEDSNDGSVNRDESDLVQVGYADRPCDTDDKATVTSTPKTNGHSKSRNNLNDLGWPTNVRIDPWMAAVWQNATKSPLCGLPDHILLNIMRRLDLTAICQLRRASREFLRLFSSHEFEKWWYKGIDYEFLWASPVPAPGSVDALKFGATSAYCAPCFANRNPSGWKRSKARCELYCSRCKQLHTASLFSAAERNKAPVERICIGREGYIRLCEHKTFNWDDFVRVSSEASKSPRDGGDLRNLRLCKHASHQPGLPPVEYNADLFDQWVYLEKTVHMSFPHWRKNKHATRGRVIPRKGHDTLTPWVASTLTFASACITKAEKYSNLCFTPKHQKPQVGWQPALVALGPENAVWCLDSEFRRCGKHKKCLKLFLTRSFSATDNRGRAMTPSSPQWYLALDPASHHLTEDDEFKEVTWCEDQACRNYYKFRVEPDGPWA
ncbi:hypothetical protein CcaCcLH18_03597 [Colletotrichum camelliae]|nr:hypothetical protein CcaCcLH18_03597 [Colletotrichum camelliae]